MTYYDTAYLAKCYLPEPGHLVVREHAETAGAIACSDLGRAELAAVFHRHHREGRLDRQAFDTVFEQFEADLEAGIWHWVPFDAPIQNAVVEAFRALLPSVFLRSADAIHLVSARRLGCLEVFTSDRQMLRACEAFGLNGRNLLDAPRDG